MNAPAVQGPGDKAPSASAGGAAALAPTTEADHGIGETLRGHWWPVFRMASFSLAKSAMLVLALTLQAAGFVFAWWLKKKVADLTNGTSAAGEVLFVTGEVALVLVIGAALVIHAARAIRKEWQEK